MSVFREAGDRFFNEYEKYGRDRAAAIAELEIIRGICEMGIHHFYGSITEGARPDVQVTGKSENQVSIAYGVRQCGFASVRKGPEAVVFVTPDGGIVAAKGRKWLHHGEPGEELQATTISTGSRDGDISRWLIEFMEEAEGEFRKMLS